MYAINSINLFYIQGTINFLTEKDLDIETNYMVSQLLYDRLSEHLVINDWSI